MRRPFTLIEILIAIALLALVSGLVGTRMYGAIEKKRFSSRLGQLKERLIVAQKLAVTSQADWTGVFQKDKEDWIFCIQTEEEGQRSFRPLNLGTVDLFWNGTKVQKTLSLHFFASGYVVPKGILSLQSDSRRENINLLLLAGQG